MKPADEVRDAASRQPGSRWFASSVLAAGPASGTGFSDVAIWLAVLGLLVIVGGVVLLHLRRRMGRDESAPPTGFTLHDLREMHARGELTDEEFQRARTALLAGVRRSADESPADGV